MPADALRDRRDRLADRAARGGDARRDDRLSERPRTLVARGGDARRAAAAPLDLVAASASRSGFEYRDPESDRDSCRPSASALGLPLFDRNRGPIAQAEAERARARPSSRWRASRRATRSRTRCASGRTRWRKSARDRSSSRARTRRGDVAHRVSRRAHQHCPTCSRRSATRARCSRQYIDDLAAAWIADRRAARSRSLRRGTRSHEPTIRRHRHARRRADSSLRRRRWSSGACKAKDAEPEDAKTAAVVGAQTIVVAPQAVHRDARRDRHVVAARRATSASLSAPAADARRRECSSPRARAVRQGEPLDRARAGAVPAAALQSAEAALTAARARLRARSSVSRTRESCRGRTPSRRRPISRKRAPTR